MKILITYGPSYEPIDGARRLTNMSTGRLGVTLANDFAKAGHEVICLKGEGSTCPEPLVGGRLETFSTNDDLARKLGDLARAEAIDVVLHAAALCDYRVEQVRNEAGETLVSEKFATRGGRLHLVLAPALKVLPQLRGWFPQARIVGWKYELVGTRDDAFAKAWRQLRESGTDACVLNGAAYGEGFAICQPAGAVTVCADLGALSTALGGRLEADRSRAAERGLA